MIMYVVDASHKDAVYTGVPVDELAEAIHAIPAEGIIIEVNGKLICFMADES